MPACRHLPPPPRPAAPDHSLRDHGRRDPDDDARPVVRARRPRTRRPPARWPPLRAPRRRGRRYSFCELAGFRTPASRAALQRSAAEIEAESWRRFTASTFIRFAVCEAVFLISDPARVRRPELLGRPARRGDRSPAVLLGGAGPGERNQRRFAAALESAGIPSYLTGPPQTDSGGLTSQPDRRRVEEVLDRLQRAREKQYAADGSTGTITSVLEPPAGAEAQWFAAGGSRTRSRRGWAAARARGSRSGSGCRPDSERTCRGHGHADPAADPAETGLYGVGGRRTGQRVAGADDRPAGGGEDGEDDPVAEYVGRQHAGRSRRRRALPICRGRRGWRRACRAGSRRRGYASRAGACRCCPRRADPW